MRPFHQGQLDATQQFLKLAQVSTLPLTVGRTLKRQRILNTFRENSKCGRQWVSLPKEAPSR